MYARVTRLKGDPAKLAQVTEQLQAKLVPIFEQQPGYLGVISVANRETGEGATTTYWDSMEHLKASEAAIFAARDKFAQEEGTEIVSFHRVEIAVQERKADAKPGNHVRAVTITGARPDQLDAIVQRFRTLIAPKILSLPGSRAALMHVDRENNVLIGVSSYDTPEQRDAASGQIDPLRKEVERDFGVETQIQHAETTYADLRVPAPRQ